MQRLIADFTDCSYSINKLSLIQSSSCDKPRKRSKRKSLQDLISSIDRFFDGLFSEFPSLAVFQPDAVDQAACKVSGNARPSIASLVR
jgi:hypothetical protein